MENLGKNKAWATTSWPIDSLRDEYGLKTFSITFSHCEEKEFPRTAYAIYAKSGFYKTWKFIWVPDVCIQAGTGIEYVNWEFYNNFPGFKILKLIRTDAKTHDLI